VKRRRGETVHHRSLTERLGLIVGAMKAECCLLKRGKEGPPKSMTLMYIKGQGIKGFATEGSGRRWVCSGTGLALQSREMGVSTSHGKKRGWGCISLRQKSGQGYSLEKNDIVLIFHCNG